MLRIDLEEFPKKLKFIHLTIDSNPNNFQYFMFYKYFKLNFNKIIIDKVYDVV